MHKNFRVLVEREKNQLLCTPGTHDYILLTNSFVYLLITAKIFHFLPLWFLFGVDK